MKKTIIKLFVCLSIVFGITNCGEENVDNKVEIPNDIFAVYQAYFDLNSVEIKQEMANLNYAILADYGHTIQFSKITTGEYFQVSFSGESGKVNRIVYNIGITIDTPQPFFKNRDEAYNAAKKITESLKKDLTSEIIILAIHTPTNIYTYTTFSDFLAGLVENKATFKQCNVGTNKRTLELKYTETSSSIEITNTNNE